MKSICQKNRKQSLIHCLRREPWFMPRYIQEGLWRSERSSHCQLWRQLLKHRLCRRPVFIFCKSRSGDKHRCWTTGDRHEKLSSKRKFASSLSETVRTTTSSTLASSSTTTCFASAPHQSTSTPMLKNRNTLSMKVIL